MSELRTFSPRQGGRTVTDKWVVTFRHKASQLLLFKTLETNWTDCTVPDSNTRSPLSSSRYLSLVVHATYPISIEDPFDSDHGLAQ
jgi:hypothetical protein